MAVLTFNTDGLLASVEPTGRGEIAQDGDNVDLICARHGMTGSVTLGVFRVSSIDAVLEQRRATLPSYKSDAPAD